MSSPTQSPDAAPDLIPVGEPAAAPVTPGAPPPRVPGAPTADPPLVPASRQALPPAPAPADAAELDAAELSETDETPGSPGPPGAAEPSRRSVLGRGWPSWWSPADREVLSLYLLTRVAVWVSAYCARWVFPADSRAHTATSALAPFQQWDWGHFLHVARDGYFPADAGVPSGEGDNREAFFPGFPLALRAVHVLVPSWAASGLLISFVAGAVAVVALARIARAELPRAAAGRRAVLFLLLSPCAIFLAVGYSEALFLALALPAWLAARRDRWALAAVLTALATSVRISGLFLAAALLVRFVSSARARGVWRPLPWLALPALPAALYTTYLHEHTGDWMAWKHAQERGWYRDFHTPWEAWSNTWHAAFASAHPTGYAFMFQAELVAMVVGLLLLGFLLLRRRWPEATYMALTLWALGTSHWYMSIPRATLLWWPLWIGLAAWSLRRPRLTTAYACVVGPLATVFTLAFLTGRWTG
ncbi:mannosyltransferase family protein [Streptomyces sp. NPDC057702]|uniref:mannosyltransferase family protein n=1 Tax=unclassified Streptomyces TaxID=2593676 RepID=UPI00367393C4